MIEFKGRNEISQIHYNDKDLILVFMGAILVWELLSEIQSCYANGYWIDEYPWTEDTVWKDDS